MQKKKKRTPLRWYGTAIAVVAFVCALIVTGCLLRPHMNRPGEGTSADDTGSGIGREDVPDVTDTDDDTETTYEDPPFSTDPPVTDPPVTDPPVTDPPVTDPPVTDPPVTDPPVTDPPVTDPPVTDPPVTDPPVTDPPVTDPPVTDPPVTDPPVTDPPVTEPPVTDPPVTDPAPDSIVVVPEGEIVDDSYFHNAAFIGDSRTVGLYLYSGLRSNYYAEQGLNISTVQTKAFVSEGESKIMLADALRAKSYHAVYISFGINEIGWSSTQAFISTYISLIQLVQTELPEAEIYIQSILPMSKTTAESDRYRPMGGNDKVAEYNARLLELCETMGLRYINLIEIFTDANGDLTVSDSFDGIHLGVASSRAWADYLRCHVIH